MLKIVEAKIGIETICREYNVLKCQFCQSQKRELPIVGQVQFCKVCEALKKGEHRGAAVWQLLQKTPAGCPLQALEPDKT